MFFSFLVSTLLFAGITLGLAWPLAARLALNPAEKLTASIALSLLGIFLFAWVVYVCDLPLALMWALPAVSAVGLLAQWRSLQLTLRDFDATSLAIAQGIITLWSIGWLALVLNYSGGGWLADWFGHMQRTWFFLDRGPHDILFNGFDALTSRPPLANVVNGAFLAVTQRNFAHYQFFSTLFASLAFLPAGLLANRWGGRRAIAVLTLLFMVSPMYLQNATYAWTKLPAAFFTLAALYFFLRAHEEQAPRVHAVLFAVTLAGGLLTHYSAGPYAVILGVAWLVLGWQHHNRPAWWKATALAVLAGAMVLAVWFGWAFSVYGLRGSLLTNTSITDKAPGVAAQLQVAILNVRDTLAPHFVRTLDFELLAQRASAGWWRDWFFNLYQVNFFFAFGCIAWAVILIGLIRVGRKAPNDQRAFWSAFIIGNSILGISVHGARDTWGLAQICLQPLIILGLAFLASQWSRLRRVWRLVLIGGATVDFALGILLQFGVQAYALERWFTPNRSIFDIIADYSLPAQMNFYAKFKNNWIFFGDIFAEYGSIIVGLLGALFFAALWLASRPRTDSQPVANQS